MNDWKANLENAFKLKFSKITVCIVNAYCQFSQQARTNFKQTYLHCQCILSNFSASVHQFYSNILVFVNINDQLALENVDIFSYIIDWFALDYVFKDHVFIYLWNPISISFSGKAGVGADDWCHGNNDFLQLDGKSMFNYSGHSTTTWTNFDPPPPRMDKRRQKIR